MDGVILSEFYGYVFGASDVIVVRGVVVDKVIAGSCDSGPVNHSASEVGCHVGVCVMVDLIALQITVGYAVPGDAIFVERWVEVGGNFCGNSRWLGVTNLGCNFVGLWRRQQRSRHGNSVALVGSRIELGVCVGCAFGEVGTEESNLSRSRIRGAAGTKDDSELVGDYGLIQKPVVIVRSRIRQLANLDPLVVNEGLKFKSSSVVGVQIELNDLDFFHFG